MKEFLQLMRICVALQEIYRLGNRAQCAVRYINVFSFTLLIPILNILFKTGANTEVYHFMEWGNGSLKEVAVNNFVLLRHPDD